MKINALNSTPYQLNSTPFQGHSLGSTPFQGHVLYSTPYQVAFGGSSMQRNMVMPPTVPTGKDIPFKGFWGGGLHKVDKTGLNYFA